MLGCRLERTLLGSGAASRPRWALGVYGGRRRTSAVRDWTASRDRVLEANSAASSFEAFIVRSSL